MKRLMCGTESAQCRRETSKSEQRANESVSEHIKLNAL